MTKETLLPGTRRLLGKPTARERIREVILKNGNKYMTAAELNIDIPEHTIGSIYNSTSNMVLRFDELERNAHNGYRLTNKGLKYAHLQCSKPQTPELELESEAKPYEMIPPPKEPIPNGASGVIETRLTTPQVKVVHVAEGVGSRKHPVHWTPQEKALLASTTYHLRAEGHSTSIAFGLAQAKALPPERRRELQANQWEEVGVWLYPMLDAIKEAYAEAGAKEEPPPPPPPATDELLTMLLERGTALFKKVLIEALTSKEVKDMLVPQRAELKPEGTPAQIPRHDPSPVGAEKKQLPRIMIIGLPKPHQQAEVAESYKGQLDIRFESTDTNTVQVRAKATGVKTTLILSDHVNHKVVNTFKYADLPFERIAGHISNLKQRLTEIAKEHMQ